MFTMNTIKARCYQINNCMNSASFMSESIFNCNLYSQNKQARQLFTYDVISQYTKNTIL